MYWSWCGAVRIFRNFCGSAAVRSESYERMVIKMTVTVDQNFWSLVENTKAFQTAFFNYRIFNLFIWDNLKLFFVSVFSVCWRTSEKQLIECYAWIMQHDILTTVLKLTYRGRCRYAWWICCVFHFRVVCLTNHIWNIKVNRFICLETNLVANRLQVVYFPRLLN